MKPATKVGPGCWRCGDCTGDLVMGNYLICPDDGNRYDIWDGTPVPYAGEKVEPASGAVDLQEALSRVADMMATDPRDWSTSRRDAWLYGLFCGWGCEEQHDHDWICGDQDGMKEVAAKHGWADVDVDRLRRYRAAIANAQERTPTPPPSPEREEKETQ